MPNVLYGISQCDSVKKARRWLDQHEIPYHFYDFRRDGLSLACLQSWLAQQPDLSLLNRKSTTWRQLSAEQQALADNPTTLLDLLQQHPTLIKRPVLHTAQRIEVGFSEARYEECFPHAQ